MDNNRHFEKEVSFTFWISFSQSPQFALRPPITKDQSKTEVIFRLDSANR